jgi:hypothetical protein
MFLKMAAFWDIMQCNLAKLYRPFKVLAASIRALMMEAASICERR